MSNVLRFPMQPQAAPAPLCYSKTREYVTALMGEIDQYRAEGVSTPEQRRLWLTLSFVLNRIAEDERGWGKP